MKIQDALTIVRRHSRWLCSGFHIDVPHPEYTAQAIDLLLHEIETNTNGKGYDQLRETPLHAEALRDPAGSSDAL